MEFGESVARQLQASLVVFRLEATAGLLFALMLGACLLLCVIYYWTSIMRPLHALRQADRALGMVSFVSTTKRVALESERTSRLDEAVRGTAERTAVGYRILLAWRRRLAALHAGLPSGEEPIVRAASVLGPQPRWLGNAADAIVGIGLVFTFLGLVAGLGAATEALSAAGDPRRALLGLLGAASVKFLTSIAGIGGAMILRLWQAFWLARVAAAASRLSEDLDAHLLDVGNEIGESAT